MRLQKNLIMYLLILNIKYDLLVTIYRNILFWSLISVFYILPNVKSRFSYFNMGSIIKSLTSKRETSKFLLIGYIHHLIHIFSPFLDENGYNINYTPFYDVVCHLYMIVFCYQLVCEKSKQPDIFHTLSSIFIFGSLLNVITSILPVYSKFQIIYIIFSYLSIFQAISTAYWITTLLTYKYWNNFMYNFYLVSSIIVGIWGFYMYDDTYVGLSMKYRFIEGLFIISTWVI